MVIIVLNSPETCVWNLFPFSHSRCFKRHKHKRFWVLIAEQREFVIEMTKISAVPHQGNLSELTIISTEHLPSWLQGLLYCILCLSFSPYLHLTQANSSFTFLYLVSSCFYPQPLKFLTNSVSFSREILLFQFVFLHLIKE